MLRSEIQDGAVSAAKACAHATVEPRHVRYALARRFRENPEVEKYLDEARKALEPHGGSYGTPSIGAEATALLETLKTEADAVAALVAAFEPGGTAAPAGSDSGAQAQEGAEADTAAERPAGGAAAPPAETTAEILDELDALIGLAAVKRQVRNVIAVVQANTERVKAGLTPVNPSLHLVFTGPPGTGKTTVARIVARLYAATGALPGSRFTEATRADLIAGYVGQTAIKTQEIIQKTRPGVLFIDEAYALTPRGDVDFGHEAISTLVKAMEDHRGDLAVIVAGYEDEMSEFIASNPGLRSRFKTFIDFPDYGPDELTRIFLGFVAEAGLTLADGVEARAAQLCGQMAERRNFGNARFARSLFEQAYARMAVRAATDGAVTVAELTTLLPEDLQVDPDTLTREVRRIGFRTGGEADETD